MRAGVELVLATRDGLGRTGMHERGVSAQGKYQSDGVGVKIERVAVACATGILPVGRALPKKSFVGGVSDADCVHHHKPLWFRDDASGSETPPTDFLGKAHHAPSPQPPAIHEEKLIPRPWPSRSRHG